LGASLDMCRELIARHEPFAAAAQAGQMTVDGLTNYLVSGECDLFDGTTHQRVCQDMSQPFANYFVLAASAAPLPLAAAGPLTRHALRPLADALTAGCRFIERELPLDRLRTFCFYFC